MIDNIFILYIHYLITGWWYTYPPEKYESQIGSSSQLLGKIKAMFLSPPTRYNMFEHVSVPGKCWLPSHHAYRRVGVGEISPA
jgi:hypothetical protein